MASREARRKACDLCFTKKIKCDMLEPECSNCTLYNAQCRTSVARRMANPPRTRPKTVTAGSNTGAPENPEDMKARLERIEKQLYRVMQRSKTAHTQASTSQITNSLEENSGSNSKSSTSWNFDPVEPKLYLGPSDKSFCLPALDKIIPIVDYYFSNSNRVIPLFNQDSSMRLITGWYGKNPKRDTATWAAILMIIALGIRSLPPGDTTICPSSLNKTEWVNYCMRNAQSAIPDLMNRDEDLLGIQAILSLAILFHNSGDGRPAGVMVATAMKLVHRLQLQSEIVDQITVTEAQQRSRVFWIAYMLDKDISLRTKTPSTQSDDDIDIPLPPMEPLDGAGIIWTEDGRSQFNLFRFQVDLARIEGQNYDILFSSRSLKVQGPERQARVATLHKMLEDWYERIPPAFRMDEVADTVSEVDTIHVTKMHHAYILCVVATHGVYSVRAEWQQKVSALSRAAIQDFGVATQGPRITACTQHQDPPMEEGWKFCVDLSRSSMKLFQSATPTECLIWQCSCAHVSALVVVLANIVISPTNESSWLDLEIATRSMYLFEQIMEIIRSPVYQPLEHVVKDLHKSATRVVNNAQLDQWGDIDDVTSGNGAELDMDLFIGQSDFPAFEIQEIPSVGFEFDGLLDPL